MVFNVLRCIFKTLLSNEMSYLQVENLHYEINENNRTKQSKTTHTHEKDVCF